MSLLEALVELLVRAGESMCQPPTEGAFDLGGNSGGATGVSAVAKRLRVPLVKLTGNLESAGTESGDPGAPLAGVT